MKKTFKIVDLISLVNKRNKLSTCSPQTRAGWNDILQTILFETKNYEGFSYLGIGEVPKNCQPGINCNYLIQGSESVPEEERFKNTDPTRINYYISHKLDK